MHEPRPVTEKAARAVGASAPEDYILRPREHAAALPEGATLLRAVLETTPSLPAIVADYEAHDITAGRKQKAYKFWGRGALWAHGLAILVGAVLILPWPESWMVTLPAALSDAAIALERVVLGLQVLLVLSAVLFAQRILSDQPYDAWMKARARAETARVDLFSTVMAAEPAPGATPTGLPLLPLQLEYVRRYLLDEQMNYYRRRTGQHQRAARAQKRRQGWYAGLLGLASTPFLLDLLPQFFGNGALEPWLDAGPVFATVAASTLMNILAATSLLSQDRRNATRYHETHAYLREIRDTYLEEARLAAAEGDRDYVLAFYNAVRETISAEHREWISLQEQAERPDFEGIAQSAIPRLNRKSAERKEGADHG